MIKIKFNGKEIEVAKETSLLDIINSYNLNHRSIIIELNREVIDDDKFAETVVKDNDILELINFVGGG